MCLRKVLHKAIARVRMCVHNIYYAVVLNNNTAVKTFDVINYSATVFDPFDM